MVLYAYINRDALIRAHGRRALLAFSLLEIVLVLFVLGALAAALTPSVRDIIEKSRRDSEVRTLEELATVIAQSFDTTDLTNLNVAALPGTIAATDSPTIFSASTTALYPTQGAGACFEVAWRVGLAGQRTRIVDTGRELQRGVFVQLIAGGATLGIYAFNPDSGSRYVIVSLGAQF